jgi:D-alanyl-D-alanine carboxypeptidase
MPLLWALLLPVAAVAAEESESPKMLASKLLERLDASEPVPEAFVASYFTPDVDVGERRAFLENLRQDSGGFSVVEDRGNADMADLHIVSRRGERHARIVLFPSKKPPKRVGTLFVLPARAGAPQPWPPGDEVSNADIARAIDAETAALAKEDAFSGVVLVRRHGETIYEKAFGAADQVWDIPNSAQTRFHLGSVGKMFTAVAVLQLVEAGVLSLDDSVEKWLPGALPRGLGSSIQVRHLLNHAAGLGEWDQRAPQPVRAASRIASMPTTPLFPAGQGFTYSNAGYVILEAIIEAATGRAFTDVLQDKVFRSSGMDDSGLWATTAIVPRRATGYLRPESDPLGFHPRYSNEQFLGFIGDGSGGEYATASDVADFLAALQRGKLLNAAQRDAMLAGHADFAGAARPMKYGYGALLTACGGRDFFGHEGGGTNSGVSSTALASRDGEWTLVVLSNYDPPAPSDLAYSICEFLGAQKATPAPRR